MEKVKPEVIVIKDEDSNDDVIDCTPTKTKKKFHKREPKKKERKVERAIDTSSNTETLVVTQKVKRRKQKIQCIINLTNICEHSNVNHRDKPKQKVKTSTAKVHAKRPVKVEKVVPICLRKNCRIDLNRKIDYRTLKREPRKELERRNSKEHCRGRKLDVSIDRKDIKDRHGRSNNGKCNSSPYPRASRHRQRRSPIKARYLSPVSSASLSDVLSEYGEGGISYDDISSDSEIDTLIKRTKDRERTQYNKDDMNKHHKCDHKHSSNSWTNNYDDIAYIKHTEHTENLEKTNYLQSFEKTESQQYHKSQNACNSANDRPKYDYTFDRESMSLITTDKPGHDYEQIDGQNKPMATTTANFEDTHDDLATDDGTLLTSEMDIVSFHSEGTLVLNFLYSPTESISVKSDAYSPTVSPAFFDQQGGIDNIQSHCVASPVISPPFTPLVPNIFDYSNPTEKANDADNLNTIIKQEQNLSPMLIGAQIQKIDKAKSNASFVSNQMETTDVRVKIECDPEEDNTETTFEGKFNNITNMKEEIDEDSMNNNIKLHPASPSASLYLSMLGANQKCVDDNLGINTIKKEK